MNNKTTKGAVGKQYSKDSKTYENKCCTPIYTVINITDFYKSPTDIAPRCVLVKRCPFCDCARGYSCQPVEQEEIEVKVCIHHLQQMDRSDLK